uniref:hypothetical protein n=1 Tax=Candidatus Planktophila sp. TaxID=2175601 RepID=UPI004049AE23
MNQSVRQAIFLPFCLVMAISLSSPASADRNSSPSSDAKKIAQENYKKEREIYITAIRKREISMREINVAFKIAIDKANFEARIAMWAATTPERKSAVASNRRSAVATAIVERDAAINDLGPAPMPPISLQKSIKFWKEGKGKARR